MIAAARALATTVADDELNANYIIPSVFHKDVAKTVAAAVREAALAAARRPPRRPARPRASSAPSTPPPSPSSSSDDRPGGRVVRRSNVRIAVIPAQPAPNPCDTRARGVFGLVSPRAYGSPARGRRVRQVRNVPLVFRRVVPTAVRARSAGADGASHLQRAGDFRVARPGPDWLSRGRSGQDSYPGGRAGLRRLRRAASGTDPACDHALPA